MTDVAETKQADKEREIAANNRVAEEGASGAGDRTAGSATAPGPEDPVDQVATPRRRRHPVVTVLIGGVVLVILLVLLDDGLALLQERNTRIALAGTTWQLTSYTENFFDGDTHFAKRANVIPDPEHYTLAFPADGTAILTSDCLTSTWSYSFPAKGIHFDLGEIIQDGRRFNGGETVLGGDECGPASPGGMVAVDFASTNGLEFASGSLILRRPECPWPCPSDIDLRQTWVPMPAQ
jgi:hypothetical protein